VPKCPLRAEGGRLAHFDIAAGVEASRDNAVTIRPLWPDWFWTVRLLIRTLQRLAAPGLGVLAVWLIVFVVFPIVDRRLPWVLALSVTYGVAAYVMLPRAVRMGPKIFQELQRSGAIQSVTFHQTRDRVTAESVNHYVTDGQVAVATLVTTVEAAVGGASRPET
jgi:hypothetical protein